MMPVSWVPPTHLHENVCLLHTYGSYEAHFIGNNTSVVRWVQHTELDGIRLQHFKVASYCYYWSYICFIY